MNIIETSVDETLAAVRRQTRAAANEETEAAVRRILADVAQRGDAAVREFERRFDGVDVAQFRVPASEIERGAQAADPEVVDALKVARENIESFHRMEIASGFVDAPRPGVVRGQKVIPLAAVGIYVPGGTAAYPSSILMNAIPAKLAGVSRIVMVTPPQREGLSPAVLAAAQIAGVDEIYTIGGAQAVAALAYGTESVPRVDKITGPGNAFVAAAKRLVYGQVDIDMVAGPSEVCAIADPPADAGRVAADLLSQAEHDALARPILITTDPAFAVSVSEAIDEQLATLPRREIATRAVEDGGVAYVVGSIEEAFEVANEIAPEHLEVQLPDAISYLALIRNAGSVFLGYAASEPLGDYLAGPNHILPTSGTARFFSPLGVGDFVKRTQFLSYTVDALREDAPAVAILARAEGLEAHARAVESRFPDAAWVAGGGDGRADGER